MDGLPTKENMLDVWSPVLLSITALLLLNNAWSGLENFWDLLNGWTNSYLSVFNETALFW